jgi:hypothetical protein
MKTLFLAMALGAAAVTPACNDDMLDVDIENFDRLPDFDRLDYRNINPPQTYQYWELRYTFGRGSGYDVTLGSGGTRQRSELDPATLTALQNSTPNSGFSNGCLPAHCYTFILAVDAGGTVRVINTRDALIEFLGLIDTMEEAALIVTSYNMYWSLDNPDTGVREVGVGWEFLALELVKACTPVQTDRVHVLVRSNGSLRELGREVHSKLENACV